MGGGERPRDVHPDDRTLLRPRRIHARPGGFRFRFGGQHVGERSADLCEYDPCIVRRRT